MALTSLTESLPCSISQSPMPTDPSTPPTLNPASGDLPASASPKRKIMLRKSPQRKAKTTVVVLRKPREGEAMAKVPSKTDEIMQRTASFDPSTEMLDHTFLGTMADFEDMEAKEEDAFDEEDGLGDGFDNVSRAASKKSKMSKASRR